MASFEFLAIVLTGLGLTASIIYYTSILRNANKTQQLALENRRAQLYMQLFLRITSEDFMKKSIDLLRWKFEDYDDFMEKYYLNEDSTLVAQWISLLWHIDGLGYLMAEGLVEPEMVYNFGGGSGQVRHWVKWESIISEMRKQRNDPEFLKWFEYLSREMMALRTEKGLKTIPE
jgi:hypothetical protein